MRPADARRAARVPLTMHPSASRHRRERMPHDSAHLTLAVIGGKWKPRIYDQLRGGAVRFGRLRRAIPGVTQTMLTQHLREMVEDGLVSRTAHAQVPPHVEYALTDLGRTLEDVVVALRAWGAQRVARAAGAQPASRPAATRTGTAASPAPGRTPLAPVAHDRRQPASAALLAADVIDELPDAKAPAEHVRRQTALTRRSTQPRHSSRSRPPHDSANALPAGDDAFRAIAAREAATDEQYFARVVAQFGLPV